MYYDSTGDVLDDDIDGAWGMERTKSVGVVRGSERREKVRLGWGCEWHRNGSTNFVNIYFGKTDYQVLNVLYD